MGGPVETVTTEASGVEGELGDLAMPTPTAAANRENAFEAACMSREGGGLRFDASADCSWTPA